MRRRSRGLRPHALIALLSLPASVAAAHGPAPVALEVLAYDGSTPILLRTNVGLARAAGDGTYDYICPSRWDGNELALSAASPDGTEILVHSAGVAFLSRDGGCAFEALTGDDVYVLDIARTAGGFVIIAEDYPDDLDPDASRIYEVSAGVATELAAVFPGAIDGVLGLAPEAGFIVSGHAPRVFVADGSGRELPVGDATASRLTPRAARGADIWLRAIEPEGVRLWRLTDGEPERSAPVEVIHGPVHDGARWLALLDGVLHEHAGAWAPLGEVEWTCLRSLERRNFACSLQAMQELSGSTGAPVASPVFSVRQLAAPSACGGAEAQLACDRDWAHFGGESGWLDTLPARTPTSERAVPSGCSVGGVPRELPCPLLILCGVIVWIYRARLSR